MEIFPVKPLKYTINKINSFCILMHRLIQIEKLMH
jgi:hypothetical protein